MMKKNRIMYSFISVVLLSGCMSDDMPVNEIIDSQQEEYTEEEEPSSPIETNEIEETESRQIRIGRLTLTVPDVWRKVSETRDDSAGTETQIWSGSYDECFIIEMSDSDSLDFTDNDAQKIRNMFHLSEENSVDRSEIGMSRMRFYSRIDEKDALSGSAEIEGSMIYGALFKADSKLYTMVLIANDNRYQKSVFDDIYQSARVFVSPDDSEIQFVFDENWKVFTDRDKCIDSIQEKDFLAELYSQNLDSVCMYAGNGAENRWIVVYENNIGEQPEDPNTDEPGSRNRNGSSEDDNTGIYKKFLDENYSPYMISIVTEKDADAEAVLNEIIQESDSSDE